jgi:hypothetical protein
MRLRRTPRNALSLSNSVFNPAADAVLEDSQPIIFGHIPTLLPHFLTIFDDPHKGAFAPVKLDQIFKRSLVNYGRVDSPFFDGSLNSFA